MRDFCQSVDSAETDEYILPYSMKVVFSRISLSRLMMSKAKARETEIEPSADAKGDIQNQETGNGGDDEDQDVEIVCRDDGESKNREKDYYEPVIAYRRMLAFATNPYYRAIKDDTKMARRLLMLRAMFAIFSLYGTLWIAIEAWQQGDNCYISSAAAVPSFSGMFTASNIIKPTTVLCRTFGQNEFQVALNDTECNIVSYSATDFFNDSELEISYVNLEKSASSPYEVSVHLKNVSLSSCFDSSDIEPDEQATDLTNKDRCSLSPWVTAFRTSTGTPQSLSPQDILFFTAIGGALWVFIASE